MTGRVEFGVLGALAVLPTGRRAVTLSPRQRTVLARLLVARGGVVPVDRLVDDLWAEPPPAAVSAVRTFVAALRRALEPDRPPRRPPELLITAPPGYLLRPAPDAVDAWRFEAAVGAAGRLPAAAALARLDDALALWRGPAYVEWAAEGWARGEIGRLDELRLLAVERRAGALLALGRAAEAATDLRAQAETHPLREDAWRLLATALYRAGRQGDALAALRRARRTLADELGVDPGPALRELETDILAQAPHLDPTAPADPATTRGPAAALGSAAAPGAARAVGSGAVRPARSGAAPFVGRDAELAALLDAARATTGRDGAPVVALLSGEPGAGKTALAEALTRRLAGDGWTTAWGRGPEHDGAPEAWPWRQISDTLTGGPGGPGPGGPGRGGAGPGGAGPGGPAGDPVGDRGADPAAARFRLRRAAVAQLAAAAAAGPVLLVLDDLHGADESTLDLLTGFAAAALPGPVLIVGTYRATEITPGLTAALARLARAEPVRVYLGGLPEAATGDLARALAGTAADPAAVRLIHRRTGGNPFFVRELARLLAAEGGPALEQIPAGVRDVIRHRLDRLPEAARAVLRQAAVLGRDVDPEVLTALAGDEEPVLDALDRGLRAGLLSEDGAGLRFTHVLVRDTLYGDLSALRRARWHAGIGAALQRLRPDDVAALAHHFGQAATRETAPRAARYARIAAERAERRSRPHEAARLWRLAVAACDRAGRTDVRLRLDALLGLGRARAVTGNLDDARRLRGEALGVAEALGDPDLTADVLAAFVVPAAWTRNDDEELSRRIVRAAEATLAALPADRPDRRALLLATIAMESRGTRTDRGDRAARAAEALARQAADPALLAYALNARYLHTFARAGQARERARIGAELVGLAARHELVTFEVLGHLILVQAHSAPADLAAADRHARAADDLAERYDLPLVGVFTAWYAGLKQAVAGRRDEATAAYRAAHDRLARAGMPGMAAGLLPLALLTLHGPDPGADYGPYQPWVDPLLRLAAGRRADAAAALHALPEPPHDLLTEARLALAARAAVALGDRATMRRLHDRLAPAAGELAGAGSGVLTLGPVAGYLDELAGR